MGYRVNCPYAVVAHDGGVWEGYEGAIVPDGLNDERCKELVDEGFLAVDDGEKPARKSK
jgi:hypothetical protein